MLHNYLSLEKPNVFLNQACASRSWEALGLLKLRSQYACVCLLPGYK